MVENCDNEYYVNEQDKKTLWKKCNPMERNMLRWLLMFDPNIKQLKKLDRKVRVFVRPFLLGFGLMQMTIEQVKELQDELQEFHDESKDCIFVLIIGALNHWITLVVHKTTTKVTLKPAQISVEKMISDLQKGTSFDDGDKHYKGKFTIEQSRKLLTDSKMQKNNTKRVDNITFYLMDSSNSQHWYYDDENVPEKYMQRVRDRVSVGLRFPSSYQNKMNIQSIFDARRSLVILQDVFTHKTPLQMYYVQLQMNNKLRFLQMALQAEHQFFNENFLQLKRKMVEYVSAMGKDSGLDEHEEKAGFNENLWIFPQNYGTEDKPNYII